MRKINRCLNNRLTDICKLTMQLEDLNTKLRHYLPSSLSSYCYVGSFNLGCLVVVVSDPVWASQLRYSVPELREKLRKEAGIYQLTSIKIMIAPPVIPLAKSPSQLPALSIIARDTILMASEQCTYIPLREALHQLALSNLTKN